MSFAGRETQGKRIRVTGSSHSFSPLVPTDEFLVYNRGMRAVSVDTSNPARPLVTVESGATARTRWRR